MTVHLVKKGQGKPLVFFHGWGFDHQIWLPLADSLANNYTLFLVDLPGFGQSLPMNWPQFKNELLKQLPKPFALIGWSLGGLYAMRLAIEEEKFVSELITIASSPYFIKDRDWPGVNKEVFDQFLTNLLKNPQKTRADFVRLQLNHLAYNPASISPINAESLKDGLHQLAQWDFRKSLKILKKPAYFLFGRLDAITPKNLMSVMQARYPQFNYYLFNKGAHMPFLSHQNEFINILNNFIL